jgi:hypothetical protein
MLVMKYTVEIASGAVISIPNFIQVGSDVPTLLGDMQILTHRSLGDLITLFFCLELM